MVAGDDGVPSFVRQCIDIIEKKGAPLSPSPPHTCSSITLPPTHLLLNFIIPLMLHTTPLPLLPPHTHIHSLTRTQHWKLRVCIECQGKRRTVLHFKKRLMKVGRKSAALNFRVVESQSTTTKMLIRVNTWTPTGRSSQEKESGLGKDGGMGITPYPRSIIEHQLVVRREVICIISTGHNIDSFKEEIGISTHNAYKFGEVTINFQSWCYIVSSRRDLCVIVVFPSLDFNLDVASLGYYENVISSTLKAFFKLLPEPLISDEAASKILAVNCECVCVCCTVMPKYRK